MRKVLSFMAKMKDTRLGCGLLSPDDVDALLEGRLDDRRLRRFLEHRHQGCAECLHLGKAADDFLDILARGPRSPEQVRFSRVAPALRARLRRELVERAGAMGTPISSDDLELIAAAGPASPVGSDPGDVRSPDDGGEGGTPSPERASGHPKVDDSESPDTVDRS